MIKLNQTGGQEETMQKFTVRYVSAVVVILLVLAGAIIALWPDNNKSSNKQPSQKQGNNQTEKSQPKSSGAGSTGSNSGSGSGSNQSSSTTTAKPNDTSKKPGSQQLTNTGPGETLAVFLGSSLLFASFHWLYQRRQVSL
jgi:cobalamin biosynthesis Mg chelatase CobN